MSRREKPKWKYIVVLDERKNPKMIYEMDDNEKLKHKFKRQPPRTHEEMMDLFVEKQDKVIFPLLPFHPQNFIMSDSTDYEEEEEHQEIPLPTLVKES